MKTNIAHQSNASADNSPCIPQRLLPAAGAARCGVRRPLAFLMLVLLLLPAAVQAQFTYTTNNGTITITGYIGPGGVVTIPNVINGRHVTSIGDYAFNGQSSLTNVTIANSVTNIGSSAFISCANLASVLIPNSVIRIEGGAFMHCRSLTNVEIPASVASIYSRTFEGCTSLTAIEVDAGNSVYSSVAGVLFDKSQTSLRQCPGGSAGTYTVPNSVTFIADFSFASCHSLTNVIIPSSVTGIGNLAFSSCTNLIGVSIPDSVTYLGGMSFYGCAKLTSVTIPNSVRGLSGTFGQCVSLISVTISSNMTTFGSDVFIGCSSLTGVYFRGNAPTIITWGVFDGATNATVYYLPGTTGWGPTYSGRPTVLWNTKMQTSDASFGVRTNQFGFTITGTSNLVIVVEACTDLVNPAWSVLGTNTLTGGSSYFSDPQWTNHPARFYRLRSP